MMERINTLFPVPEPPTTPRISPRRTLEIEIVVDQLVTKAVPQPSYLDRILSAITFVTAKHRLVPRAPVLEGRFDFGQFFVFLHRHHAHPTLEKKTAKKASRTITAKMAETTAMVVRRPTSSEFPLTCMPL